MIIKAVIAVALSIAPMQCGGGSAPPPPPLPPNCQAILIDSRVWPEKGVAACQGPSGWVQVSLLCMEPPVPIGSGETRDMQWSNGAVTYRVGPEITYHSAQCTKLFPYVNTIVPYSWA